jgi:hypothetical protein
MSKNYEILEFIIQVGNKFSLSERTSVKPLPLFEIKKIITDKNLKVI